MRAALGERGRELVADTDGEDRLTARSEEVRERDRDIIERDKDPLSDADSVVGEVVSEVKEKEPDAVKVGDIETDVKILPAAVSEDVKEEMVVCSDVDADAKVPADAVSEKLKK